MPFEEDFNIPFIFTHFCRKAIINSAQSEHGGNCPLVQATHDAGVVLSNEMNWSREVSLCKSHFTVVWRYWNTLVVWFGCWGGVECQLHFLPFLGPKSCRYKRAEDVFQLYVHNYTTDDVAFDEQLCSFLCDLFVHIWTNPFSSDSFALLKAILNSTFVSMLIYLMTSWLRGPQFKTPSRQPKGASSTSDQDHRFL